MPKVSRAPKFRSRATAVGGKTSSESKKVTSTGADADQDESRKTRVAAHIGGSTEALSRSPNLSSSATTALDSYEKGEKSRAAPTIKNQLPETIANTATRNATCQKEQGQPPLSRGQRKRQAKRDQYMRKEQLILSSLKLKREDEQKKRIDGLDAIRNALMETVRASATTENKTDSAPALVKSNKAKQKLVQKEASQMNLVLQHPAFVQDPFGAIREHLTNTRSNDAVLQQAEALQHLKDVVQKEEEKKARKREHSVKRKRKKVKATRSKAR